MHCRLFTKNTGLALTKKRCAALHCQKRLINGDANRVRLMVIIIIIYNQKRAASRELSLVSATKLRFMRSYPDALALRSANTTLVYVPRGNIILLLTKNTLSLTKKRSAVLHFKKRLCSAYIFRGNRKTIRKRLLLPFHPPKGLEQ